jgi:hypothetical protein
MFAYNVSANVTQNIASWVKIYKEPIEQWSDGHHSHFLIYLFQETQERSIKR